MEETENNVIKKDSNVSIASHINKLDIDSENSETLNESANQKSVDTEIKHSSEGNEIVEDIVVTSDFDQSSSQNSEIKKDVNAKISSGSEENSSSEETDSSAVHEQQPQKRKRKRKRRRKRKAIAAYIPDEPFTKRYKKMELSIKPKLHVKFDESGNVVSYQNNYKPRIIYALPKNLSITDSTKEVKLNDTDEDKIHIEVCKEQPEMPVISLKPRIIKAIGT